MSTTTMIRPTTQTRPTITWDRCRFTLANAISTALSGRPTADATTRAAVAILTAAADPAHADRLAPRPRESAALVARLAMWALRQVDDHVVTEALSVMTTRVPEESV